MSRITEECLKNKPKKPLNAYFKFRQDKMKLYKDEEGRNEKAKNDWENIDEKVKETMDKQYKEELEQYKVDFENWKKKFKLTDDDVKNMKEKKESKVEKSKGSKVSKKEEKSAEKGKKNGKKEEKKESPKKDSKSKDAKSKDVKTKNESKPKGKK